jgi:copper(I)-binding protein
MSRWIVLLSCLLLPASALSVEVDDGWTRALPPGQPTAAVYLTLTNPDAAAVGLVAASSGAAGRVEIHQSRQVDGMWRMRRLDKLQIPAGGTVTLEPGGVHLMLMNLNSPLREGKTIEVTLEFDNGETRSAVVEIRMPGAGHDHHH